MKDLDMSLLSDEEQALLEALIGKLDPPKRRDRLAPKQELRPSNKLKPYNLKVIYSCKTCEVTTEVVFKMLPSLDGTGLVSVRTTEVGIVIDSTSRRSCAACGCCKEFLLTKSKEDLVHLYLTVVSAM